MAKRKQGDEKQTVEELGVEIISAMGAEFRHESDRIAAIVGAAYLDSLLETLFRAVLIDDPDGVESLLRPDAPLGSNGSRYQLAYCLGLIRKDQRDDLKMIAKIRNLFAHDYKALSFADVPARDWCMSLQQPKLLQATPANLFDEQTAAQVTEYVKGITTSPRQKFEMSVIQLFGSLLRRINLVSGAGTIAWFSHDPDADQSHRTPMTKS